MKSLILKSPSKINLYLKVLGKRPNGYHDLCTLFHRISLCDTLRLKKAAAFSLQVSDPKLSGGEDNLITKAYRKLQREVPGVGGVAVYLDKKVPMGAGLGGGSANAATFLSGMKKLYGLKISDRKLAKLGGELGADIPFFLRNFKQALGLGIGEKLISIPARRKQWFILIPSEKGLSTKEVYQNLNLKGRSYSSAKAKSVVKKIVSLLEEKKIGRAAELLENDLEEPAFRLRPSLKKALIRLHSKGISSARMTGSGPTLFAILPSSKKAQDLARKLRNQDQCNPTLICHTY